MEVLGLEADGQGRGPRGQAVEAGLEQKVGYSARVNHDSCKGEMSTAVAAIIEEAEQNTLAK
ncbi:hypothetical protein TRIUR3_23692 [Triticum urartu]|uniref:Uncharacterized protein n=1 Tax=Triticum urartu TaxID=4572 RepID=M7YZS9_TRIUA|nr:hypothetical protein TRIUR3_23692 [Triticum urartu]